MLMVRRVLRLLAALCGTYWRVSIAASTRREVPSRTGPLPLTTRDTVATETPAARATS